MTRAFLALAAMVCCSAIAEQVSAMEPEHRQWEFTGFGGASFLGDHLSSMPVSGASGQESGQIRLKYSSGYQVGFRLTENVYDHWAVSLEYSFSNQHLFLESHKLDSFI